MKRAAAATLCAAALSLFACNAPEAGRPDARWYRGNTHTHTLWSDGDVAPEAAVDWYSSRGYDFLVLSDHNILAEGDFWRPIGDGYKEAAPAHVAELRERYGAETVTTRRRADGREELRLLPLAELRARFERPGRFLLIPGEEISDRIDRRPIHHGALNVGRTIPPPGGDSVREAMRNALAAIEAEGRRTGRPVLGHLNHPNYEWGVSTDDLAHVLEERYFEVYNGHRLVCNEGDAEHPSTEAMWDTALALRLALLDGPPLWALATDDAHSFREVPGVSNPGRGWIQVRATALEPDAIVEAMLAGDFYASSGVELREARRDSSGIDIEIQAEPGVGYTTRFVGTRGQRGDPVDRLAIGETFATVTGPRARYRFRGDELYVRAVIVSDRRHPNGYSPKDFESAWVQPALPRRPGTR
ncbi:MAG: hypothetical protein KDB94_13040 [Acidobacteria bacterium]|nr:hypothetical protein [Acidobacteriota bacterium]MCB9378226.1 hypothetical protein [Holophagales bacterium]